MAKPPTPLFDEIDSLQESCNLSKLTTDQKKDYHQACQFLLCYQNNKMTFTAYRREIERLLQWCYFKANKSLKQLRRDDIDKYIKFCLKPLKSYPSGKLVCNPSIN